MAPAPAPSQQNFSGIAASPSVPIPTPTLNSQPTTRNPQLASTGHPEIKVGPAISPETAEIEVIPESPEISPELAEHVDRVVRGEIELPGPIEVGVHEGQPVSIQPAAPQQPNIILPLTRAGFAAGPKQPISSSWRWLYEWVRRVILMFPGRTMYNS